MIITNQLGDIILVLVKRKNYKSLTLILMTTYHGSCNFHMFALSMNIIAGQFNMYPNSMGSYYSDSIVTYDYTPLFMICYVVSTHSTRRCSTLIVK